MNSRPEPKASIPLKSSFTEPLQVPALDQHQKRKKNMRTGKKILLGVGLFVIVLVGVFSYRFFAAGKDVLENPNDNSVLNQIGDIVSSVIDEKKLQGEEDENRINILLLGMGGEGHTGGGQYLTDTMMLASIQPKEKKIALLSIPRDLYVKIPGYWTTKLNAAYALPYAENQSEYQASQTSIEVMSAITGQTIPYYVRVDFDGFKELVDSLGGVEITVENTFTDLKYPTPSLGTEKITFNAGQTMMNGETALKFARSRHAAGVEGGDYARAKRQQKLLEAVKETSLSNQVLLDPIKVNGIINALQKHIGTNLELWEINRLAKMASEYDSSKTINRVIDDSNFVESKRITQNSLPLDILVPKQGMFDYSNIQAFVATIFDAHYVEDEAATIEIYNGTGKSGFAQRVGADLEAKGYKVITVATAQSKNFDTSVIFDRSGGKNPYTLKSLVEELGGQVSSSNLSGASNPNSDSSEQPTDPRVEQGDMVIILGKDYYEQVINADENTKIINANEILNDRTTN